MYTDGFDELNEAENRPPRTYVSTGSQDSSKLQRENERLKKSLEKEQFFNRLLDQELKDLKGSRTEGVEYNRSHFTSSGGISRSAFNILLVITIALAAFVAYSLLFNRQNNLLTRQSTSAGIIDDKNNVAVPGKTVPAITDSVATIIAEKKTANTSPASISEKKTSTISPVSVPEKKIPTILPPVTAQKQTAVPEITAKPVEELKVKSKPAHIEQVEAATAQPVTATQTPIVQQAPAEKAVVAKYIVTSKANFYNAPDGNTLRSYFISPANNKIVNALEDKNGFIYVEFKNDVGYVTKGWLSKADLTRQ
jgi:cytoskeletal protein RodZ